MAAGTGGGVVLGYLKYVLGFDSLAFEQGLGDAEKRLKAAQRSLQKTAENFKSIGKSLSTYVSAPILGAGIAVIKMSGDFEAAMNRVSISTQGSADELKSLNKLALDLGKSTTFGASDAADAMDELAKSGLTAKQILNGAAKAAVDLASAAGSELSPAATAISDVMQQFKINTAELPSVVNQITGAVNQSKLDFVDYAGAIAQAGGVAGNVGVKFDDFNAAIAGTSALFNSGSDAGTSFKTFLLALPGNSKPATKAIDEFGLKFFDAEGNMRSMAAIAEELKTKLGGLSDEAKTTVLKDIFGTDAMRSAIGLMDQGAAGIEKIKAKIAETDAAAQSAQRLKGFNGQLEQLKGSVETLAIALGNSGLLEAITGLVTGAAGLVDKLSAVDPATLKVAVAIAAITAVVGPVVIGIGAMIGAFSTMLPVIAAIGAAIATVTSVIVSGVVPALAGLIVALAPVLIPVAAVAAAVVGVYYAWKYWDQIVPIVRNLYTGIKTWLVDKLNGVWSWLRDKIAAVGKWFYDLYDAVVGHSYIPDMVDEIGQNIARLQQVMVDPAKKATERTAEAFAKLKSDLAGTLQTLFPDEVAMRALNEKGAILDGGLASKLLSPEQWAEARRKLSMEIAALQSDINSKMQGVVITPFGQAGPIDLSAANDNVTSGLEDIVAKFELTKESASRSIKGMADNVIGSLNNLAYSIKSGGILDILSSVLDLFTSVGSTGIFGKAIQVASTGIAGARANGGPVTGGQTYLVGERGPELFTASRSGYVHPNSSNGNGGGGGRGRAYFDLRGAVMTADLLAQMNQIGITSAVAGASGGSMGAQKAIARKRGRSLA